ncbi:hypothetical protein C9374_008912 [Naegleria lovaniensis]|uniref:DUF676 domain-containing protein n=1 Tax=Naegleria lovaniensis TaxID=51637 RepID=A0AA88GE71_NAELO|nr:uncharacterized protein C9374_008912 [Naegleria lovaniensis]KAG2377827.1 hypothetical protein C9374_008912 [Naegleria lovaniensis]
MRDHSRKKSSSAHYSGNKEQVREKFLINSFVLHSSTEGRQGKYDANHVHNNSASDFSVRFVDSNAILGMSSTHPLLPHQNNIKIDMMMNEQFKEDSRKVYNNSKQSQVFYIRYREQEVMLHEIVIFDISADMSTLLKYNLIDIDFQLFHLPKDKEGIQKEEKKFERMKKYEYQVKQFDVNDFVKVADRSITIRKAIRGFNLYYPAIFENWYYSILKSSIHIVLLDVSYNTLPPRRLNSELQTLSSPIILKSNTKSGGASCTSQIDATLDQEGNAETLFDETWFSSVSSYEKNLILDLTELYPNVLARNRSWKRADVISHSIEFAREIVTCLMGSRDALTYLINDLCEKSSTPTNTHEKKSLISSLRRKSFSDVTDSKYSIEALAPKSTLSNPFLYNSPSAKLLQLKPVGGLQETCSSRSLLSNPYQYNEKKKNREVETFIRTLNQKFDNDMNDFDLIPDVISSEFKPLLETIEDLWKNQQKLIVDQPKFVLQKLETFMLERMGKEWSGESLSSLEHINEYNHDSTPTQTTDTVQEQKHLINSINNLIDTNMFFYPRFSPFSLISEVSEPSEKELSVADIMGDEPLEPVLFPKESKEDRFSTLDIPQNSTASLPLAGSKSISRNGIHAQLNRNHLIVFIPGYKSSHYDFVTFKTILSMHFHDDKHQFFIVKSLDKLHSKESHNYNNSSIKTMAKLVTDEVNTHINDSELFFHKISFVCHSLGGIILRAAFYHYRSEWRKIFPYLYTFMSLSVPHLGIGPIKKLKSREPEYSNRLVRAGIWFLKSLKGEKCLQELAMEDYDEKACTGDAHKLEQCLLFQLSMTNDLAWFKQVILIGSEQDTYVPMESALIYYEASLKPLILTKKKTSKSILSRMISNLSETFANTKLIRCKCDMTYLFKNHEKKEFCSTVQVFNKKHHTTTMEDTFDDVSSFGALSFRKKESGEDSSEDEKESAFDGSKKKIQSQSFVDRITKKMNHTAYLNHVGLINGICCAFRQYLD